MASQGQPSRNAPSGPLLTHFLQPMQSVYRPRCAQREDGPVRHPVHAVRYRAIGNAGRRARATGAAFRNHRKLFWFFLRGVAIPSDFGSLLITAAVMLELCHIRRPLRQIVDGVQSLREYATGFRILNAHDFERSCALSDASERTCAEMEIRRTPRPAGRRTPPLRAVRRNRTLYIDRFGRSPRRTERMRRSSTRRGPVAARQWPPRRARLPRRLRPCRSGCSRLSLPALAGALFQTGRRFAWLDFLQRPG